MWVSNGVFYIALIQLAYVYLQMETSCLSVPVWNNSETKTHLRSVWRFGGQTVQKRKCGISIVSSQVILATVASSASVHLQIHRLISKHSPLSITMETKYTSEISAVTKMIWKNSCWGVCSSTCYIRSTKILILPAKWGHFEGENLP